MLYGMESYKIYINGFLGGFIDKTDANHIGFFEELFRNSFMKDYSITHDLNDANVLFESLFASSLVNAKKWLYTIQYSGEPRSHPQENYDLTLYSEHESNRVIDLPLSVYYVYGNNLRDRLINKPIRTVVPSKFCCFIVSNGGCNVRNQMFEMMNAYKKVDSYGKFANNMNELLSYNYWTPEFIQFLSDYKFILCFENTKFGTYSTEKIVNPYLANIIPIYWSSHHVKNIFNPESMLFLEDETPESFSDLIRKIIELDNDDAKYIEFVNRPAFNPSQIEYWNANYSIEALSNKLSKLNSNSLVLMSDKKNSIDVKYYIMHYTPLVNRKAHIMRELESAGINEYEFILSKDREHLTEDELKKFSGISSSEASLFLKHVEIFKNDGGDHQIVVFEDDAILCPDFKERLSDCLSQLKKEEWDVLFSGGCCNLHCDVEPGKLVKSANSSRGTCMYVLNVGVGKRLYDVFNSQGVIKCAIDWWFNHAQPEYNFKYFWSEPVLVEQGSGNGLFNTSLRGETNLP
jgi:hypothetical protein